jgi:outer membrane protein assembly factor BamB
MMTFAAILLAAVAQEDLVWAQFRGPGGRGTSADAVPVTWSKTENLAWKTELPGAGTSSPIVLGSKIFLTCYSGFNVPGNPGQMEQLKLKLVCLKRDDGKVLWTKEIAPQLPEQAKIRDDHGYASSTLAADKDRLYAFFGKSGVFAFDHDGKQVWRADVGSKLHGWGSGNSPVLHKNLVIVNASVESESLVALDARTGKEIWRAGGIKDSWNTPILADAGGGRAEVVVAIMGKVLGFDPGTGQQLWSCATDIPWYMVPSLLSHEGVVYAVGGRNGGGALAVRTGGKGDVTSTHRLWMVQKGSNVTSPLLHEGHLYWMNESSGVAFCAEAKTGKIVYEQRVEGAGQIYASPVLADGKIYYLSRNGRTAVVAAKPQFERLALNDFGDRSTFNASPAVAGKQLFVRSDHHLYCLGKAR